MSVFGRELDFSAALKLNASFTQASLKELSTGANPVSDAHFQDTRFYTLDNQCSWSVHLI